MGNRRHAKNKMRRGHSPSIEPGPGEAWCTQLAIVPDRTVPGSVEFAMRQTHDRLIAGLSFRRRSGVRWTQHYAAEAAHFLTTTEDPSPVRDEMLAHLADPRSLLVVAWAVGAMPEGVTFGSWDPAHPDENATEDRLLFVTPDDEEGV